MKKIIIIIVSISFFYGLFYIFNKPNNESMDKVKLAEVTHSVFYAPLYVTDALGYFKDNNIDLEIILTSGADKVAAAIMSGDVQIGLCGSEQTIYIYNNGAKDYLMNFAGLTKKDGSFLVSRNNETFDINKLNNRTILGGRAGGMPAMTLNYFLNKNNINATVDTSVDFANLASSFISGNGDYVTLFEPNASTLEQENRGYVIKSIGELGGEVPYTTFNALKSYIENNPDIIKRFNSALDKGIKYTLNNSSEKIADLLTKYFPDSSKKDLIKIIDAYKGIDAWYDSTKISKEGFYHIQEIIKYNGFLKKNVAFDKLVYTG